MSRMSRNLTQILGRLHQFAMQGNEDNPEFGWQDLTSDLSAGRAVGANAPTWSTFRGGISAYAFDDSTMNEIWITFHPNHDIIEGEDMFFHIHWAPNTTSTGTVRWGFEYSIAKGFDQEDFPAPATVYVEETISENKQYRHIVSEISEADAIPMPEVDSLILMRIFRDAANEADTFPDAVFGLTADIHYRAGKFATVGKRPLFNEPD